MDFFTSMFGGAKKPVRKPRKKVTKKQVRKVAKKSTKKRSRKQRGGGEKEEKAILNALNKFNLKNVDKNIAKMIDNIKEELEQNHDVYGISLDSYFIGFYTDRKRLFEDVKNIFSEYEDFELNIIGVRDGWMMIEDTDVSITMEEFEEKDYVWESKNDKPIKIKSLPELPKKLKKYYTVSYGKKYSGDDNDDNVVFFVSKSRAEKLKKEKNGKLKSFNINEYDDDKIE
jgi:hypothetical protein